MKKPLVLAALALAGCGTIKSIVGIAPDPKPAANLAHVTRLVAKDPDPADQAKNADALATAKGIAADADSKSDLPAILDAAGSAAAATGSPWGVILGGLASVASAALYALHRSNAAKIDDHADALAAVGPSAPQKS